jgi:plastocyanin
MQNITFNPASLNAKVGQTVKWTNQDTAPHNVTPVSGPSFTASPTFQNGGTFSLKLTKAGTIQYRCTIHPGMNGTIVVAP